MKMVVYNEKLFRFRLVQLLSAIIVVMFLITVYLSYRLLSNDNSNCPTQEYVVEHKIISLPQARTYPTSHRLAVLVPFRDRFEELLIFAPYINKFLNDQNINHDIFILNQVDSYRFNRASLINVGYLYTRVSYDYIAMHDVDLLPLNKDLSYNYPEHQPHHIAAPHLHPRYHYSKFVGGILLVKREHFQLVNGMSNKYWGWGLEDDEFYVRLRDANLNVTRPVNITTGTSDTFRHIHDKNHRKRDTTKCYNQREVTRKRDRQTGLHDVNYKIMGVNALTIDGAPISVINIQLLCNHTVTPWCDCSDKKTIENRTRKEIELTRVT